MFLAVGNVVIRVFCPADSPSIANTLRDNGYGVTVLNGEEEMERLILLVCCAKKKRERSFKYNFRN